MVGAGVLSLPYAMSELGWYVQQHIFFKGKEDVFPAVAHFIMILMTFLSM
jgi:hypothetical protein